MKLILFAMLLDSLNFNISWNQNTESDLEGYKVYYWNAQVSSGGKIDVGLNTSLDIELPNQQYSWAVTAYDTAGNESLFSNTVIMPDYTPTKKVNIRYQGDVLPSDGIDLLELTSALLGNSSVEIERQGVGYKVTATGQDFWKATDDGSFLYMTAENDFELTLKVHGMSNPHEWAKAGLMIRKDLTPGSKMGYVFATPETGKNQTGFIWRSGTDAQIKIGNMRVATYPLVELKIRRVASDIEAYYKDAEIWVLIDRQEVILPSTVLVGVATCSISTVTPVEVLYSGFVKL